MRNGFIALAAVVLISGCSSAPAAPPSKPAEPAMKPAAAKPVEAPKPVPAIDRTPIKADVSKIKFLSESSELFGFDDGEYEVVVTASCTAAKGENAKFKLKVDGEQVGSETQLKSEDAKDYAFTAALKAGDRKIATEFTNDLYKEGEYDLNFYLNGLKLVRTK